MSERADFASGVGQVARRTLDSIATCQHSGCPEPSEHVIAVDHGDGVTLFGACEGHATGEEGV